MSDDDRWEVWATNVLTGKRRRHASGTREFCERALYQMERGGIFPYVNPSLRQARRRRRKQKEPAWTSDRLGVCANGSVGRSQGNTCDRSSAGVARLLGATYRQIMWLVLQGHVEIPRSGSGSHHHWTDEEIEQARALLSVCPWCNGTGRRR